MSYTLKVFDTSNNLIASYDDTTVCNYKIDSLSISSISYFKLEGRSCDIEMFNDTSLDSWFFDSSHIEGDYVKFPVELLVDGVSVFYGLVKRQSIKLDEKKHSLKFKIEDLLSIWTNKKTVGDLSAYVDEITSVSIINNDILTQLNDAIDLNITIANDFDPQTSQTVSNIIITNEPLTKAIIGEKWMSAGSSYWSEIYGDRHEQYCGKGHYGFFSFENYNELLWGGLIIRGRYENWSIGFFADAWVDAWIYSKRIKFNYNNEIERIEEILEEVYNDHFTTGVGGYARNRICIIANDIQHNYDGLFESLSTSPNEEYSWDGFQKKISSMLNVLFDVYPDSEKKLKVNELLLRYIDAIDFDYENNSVFNFLVENMKTNIELQEELFDVTRVGKLPSGFDLRFSFPSTEPNGIMQLRFARGKRKEVDALIWETALQLMGTDIPNTQGEIIAWVDEAHTLVHNWFFKVIEGKLERMFE